jgi:hypothetical protein
MEELIEGMNDKENDDCWAVAGITGVICCQHNSALEYMLMLW